MYIIIQKRYGLFKKAPVLWVWGDIEITSSFQEIEGFNLELLVLFSIKVKDESKMLGELLMVSD